MRRLKKKEVYDHNKQKMKKAIYSIKQRRRPSFDREVNQDEYTEGDLLKETGTDKMKRVVEVITAKKEAVHKLVKKGKSTKGTVEQKNIPRISVNQKHVHALRKQIVMGKIKIEKKNMVISAPEQVELNDEQKHQMIEEMKQIR